MRPRCDHPHYIGNNFRNRFIEFPDGSEWQLTRKISEKCRHVFEPPVYHSDDDEDKAAAEEVKAQVSEATAVFEALQTLGLAIGSEAIIKIRMQIPSKISPDADERAKEAGIPHADETQMELCALRRFKGRCLCTPQLLAWKEEKQTEKMWVPGGYTVFILMSKLPGERGTGLFWDPKRYDLEKRNLIRDSFRCALESVHRLRIEPIDPKLDNLIWDDATERCFIVDFEDCEDEMPYPEQTLNWSESYWFFWGLAQHHGHDPVW